LTSEDTGGASPEGQPEAGGESKRVDQGDLWGAGGEQAAGPVLPPRGRRLRQRTWERAPVPAAPIERPADPATAAESTDEPAVAAESPVGPAAAVPPPPLQGEAVPAYTRPAVPAYDDDDEDDYYEEEPSALANPVLLAAIAVGAAIVLAVIVVVLFGSDNNEGSPGDTTAIATATPTATPAGGIGGTGGARGLLARSIAISTVREGPALSYLELGTLPADQNVDVVGRNEEATWFQIVFPADSELVGWVPETALSLPDNVAAVVGVTDVTPVARPEVPTNTPQPDPEDTPKPGRGEGPDLAVSIKSACTAGTEIVITISNAGTEAFDQDLIEVIVSRDSVVQYQQPFQAEMEQGASAELNTGVPAQAPEMSVVVLLTELEDVNPSNNGDSCQVQSSGANNGNNDDDEGLLPAIATRIARD
jgi:hypothetical protein